MKNKYTYIALLVSLIFCYICNQIWEVDGFSYAVGVCTLFVYEMVKSLGDEDE